MYELWSGLDSRQKLYLIKLLKAAADTNQYVLYSYKWKHQRRIHDECEFEINAVATDMAEYVENH